MATPRQIAAINLYAAIMEEVKLRLSCMDTALTGATLLPPFAIREFCFLQLRMLGELIALGCLTAHGDIEETTKLKNEYSTDKIIGLLGKLHKDFYPFPVKQEAHDKHKHHLTGINEGFLTKADLLTLNGKCGDVMHRGSMKKLLSPTITVQTNFPDIVSWGRRINTLLNHHGILLFDQKTIMICMLRNRDDNMRVQVAIAETKEP
jgi:hypothetical protein